uniref:Uncharacterized protein n=1 Tax=Solibacter usitatus (strain Ellin6076) TaxID=234267 RepID=Q01WE3_SOLUE
MFSQPTLSRRSLLFLAGSACWAFAGKEFWDAKEPGDWTSDDIAKLLTKSPWAKPTSAESVKTQKNSAPNSSIPNTMPGARNPRNPAGMGRNRNPSAKTVTTYKGTVVWESAAPVRAALKTKLPDGFEGSYVLGMSGVPLAKSESKTGLERVRQLTTLHTKAQPAPLEAATIQLDNSNGTVYLFGFSREALSIAKDEKEVVFTTHMGKLTFTAKFNPKDMLYRSELAL